MLYCIQFYRVQIVQFTVDIMSKLCQLLEWKFEFFLSVEWHDFIDLDGNIIAGSGASMDFSCKNCLHIHRFIHHDKWSADILFLLQTTGANKAARYCSGVCVEIDEVQYTFLCYVCVQTDEVEFTVLC
jgi:xylose isomerase